MKRRKGIAFQRHLKALLRAYAAGQISFEQVDASVQGWINHARYGDTWGLRRALFSELVVASGQVR